MKPPSVVTRVEHYENFPVASILCPAHLRAPIAAIYHFARTADDIADEGNASAQERLETLEKFRSQLILISERIDFDPAKLDPLWVEIFVELGSNLHRHQLPARLFHDLLDAFAQDIAKTRDRAGYADEVELHDYCRRSANPIGRLLLHLYDRSEREALIQSDAICTTLQLINFWQDPSVDIPRGRYYFTAAAMAKHGVEEADLLALRQTASITAMLKECVQSARASMAFGAPLVHKVPGRAGWELRLVVQGGLRILDKIEALQYATLKRRPTLRTWDFVIMGWRALWMSSTEAEKPGSMGQ